MLNDAKTNYEEKLYITGFKTAIEVDVSGIANVSLPEMFQYLLNNRKTKPRC